MIKNSLALRASACKSLEYQKSSDNVSKNSVETSNFLNALEKEYTEYANICIGMFFDLFPEISKPDFSIVIDCDDFGINAFVTGKKRPRITIPIGTVLALEDIILSASLFPGFLSDTNNDEEIQNIKQKSVIWDRLPEESKLQYKKAFSKDEINFHLLSSGFPLEDWRLLQCQSLFEATFSFIVYHELAHWLEGHIDYAILLGFGENSGLREIPENIEHSNDDLLSVKQCLEMQADSFAFDALVSLHKDIDDPNSIGHRFNKNLSCYNATFPSETLSILNETKAIRLLTVGASLAIMLLEAYFAKNKDCSEHPKPETRIFTLLQDLFVLSLYEYGTHDDDGSFTMKDTPEINIVSDCKTIMRETLAPALYDSKILATLLQVPNLLLETADQRVGRNPRTFRDSPILNDLVTIIVNEHETPQFRTKAATHFAELRTKNEKVRAICSHFSKLTKEKTL